MEQLPLDMIRKIYSKLDPTTLLNIIYKHEESIKPEEKIVRQEITEQTNFLQAMMFEIPCGTEIKAHKHNPQERKTNQTHEALIVFKGSVELSIYDVNNELTEIFVLKAGDCSVLINGGHYMKILEKSTLFEFKNGPYFNAERDRTYFN